MIESLVKRVVLIVALGLGTGSIFAQRLPLEEIIQDADVLIQNYQFNNALLLMDKAEDSLHTGLLQRKGWCYAKLGNYSEAIAAYQTVTETDTLNREALYQLGQLYSISDQYPQAMACYRKLITQDSANSFYYRQYAAVAVKAEDLGNGISGYLQAIHLNPRDMEAYAQLATILIEAEQYHFVDSMLSEVLAVSENNQLRLLLARANLGGENYESLIENVNMILSNRDTTATYARLLGIGYFQLEQYPKVIPCMEFLIEQGVKADWVYYYLGTAYQQLNEPLKGVEFLNLAIEEGISDNIGTYYTQLAMAYEELKDFKNAIRNYRAAYERSKTDILLYHLARNYDVYYKDKQQAQVYYKKYLNSDDTIKMAKQYSQHRLEVLSALR